MQSGIEEDVLVGEIEGDPSESSYKPHEMLDTWAESETAEKEKNEEVVVPRIDFSGLGMSDDLVMSTTQRVRATNDSSELEEILKQFATEIARETTERAGKWSEEMKEHHEKVKEDNTSMHGALDEYKTRLHEVSQKLKSSDIQMDILRGQVSRRDTRLLRQREAFFKELSVLREQIMQACKLGEEFRPDWMTFLDWTSPIMDDDDDDDTEGRMIPEKEYNAMKEKYEKEMQELRFKKNADIEALQTELNETKEIHEATLAQQKVDNQRLNDNYEKQRAEMMEQQSGAVEELEEKILNITEELNLEKEEALAVLRDEMEEQISESRAELEETKAKMSELEVELSSLKSAGEELEQRIRAEVEGDMTSRLEEMKEEMNGKLTAAESGAERLEEEIRNLEDEIIREKMKTEDFRSLAISKSEEPKAAVINPLQQQEIDDLREENRQLKEEIERMKREGAPPAAKTLPSGTVAVPEEKIQNLEKGMDMDDEYAKQIANENWGLVKARVKMKFGVSGKQKPVDPVENLDVFSRLEERFNQLTEKLKEKKRILIRERQINLERVLSSLRVLVKPEAKKKRIRLPRPYQILEGDVPVARGRSSRTDVSLERKLVRQQTTPMPRMFKNRPSPPYTAEKDYSVPQRRKRQMLHTASHHLDASSYPRAEETESRGSTGRGTPLSAMEGEDKNVESDRIRGDVDNRMTLSDLSADEIIPLTGDERDTKNVSVTSKGREVKGGRRMLRTVDKMEEKTDIETTDMESDNRKQTRKLERKVMEESAGMADGGRQRISREDSENERKEVVKESAGTVMSQKQRVSNGKREEKIVDVESTRIVVSQKQRVSNGKREEKMVDVESTRTVVSQKQRVSNGKREEKMVDFESTRTVVSQKQRVSNGKREEKIADLESTGVVDGGKRKKSLHEEDIESEQSIQEDYKAVDGERELVRKDSKGTVIRVKIGAKGTTTTAQNRVVPSPPPRPKGELLTEDGTVEKTSMLALYERDTAELYGRDTAQDRREKMFQSASDSSASDRLHLRSISGHRGNTRGETLEEGDFVYEDNVTNEYYDESVGETGRPTAGEERMFLPREEPEPPRHRRTKPRTPRQRANSAHPTSVRRAHSGYGVTYGNVSIPTLPTERLNAPSPRHMTSGYGYASGFSGGWHALGARPVTSDGNVSARRYSMSARGPHHSRSGSRRTLPNQASSVSRLEFGSMTPAERRQAILDMIYRGSTERITSSRRQPMSARFAVPAELAVYSVEPARRQSRK